MSTANIVSISGGKDSTATLLKAIEDGAENLTAAFADTGNEHPQTYEFVRYLEQRLGIAITWAKADFSDRFRKRREFLQSDKCDWPEDLKQQALALMHPTGNQFLDICLLKGRFPSRMAQFCTQELKATPINEQVIEPLMASHSTLYSWQGVRWDESPKRANLATYELEFGDPDKGTGLWNYRPILSWSAQDVFDMHRRHGVDWNPLYEQGMERVGCMPCINVKKGELREIARRFPEQIERISEWEQLVSAASKRGCATFFTVKGETDVSLERHGVHSQVEWSRTTHGGKQWDLIAHAEADDEAPGCQSVYGLCE